MFQRGSRGDLPFERLLLKGLLREGLLLESRPFERLLLKRLLLKQLMEANHHPGIGIVVDFPQGTDDVGGSGLQEGTRQTNVCRGDRWVASHGGFAGGEADQVILPVGEGLTDVSGGDAVVASQGQG